MAKQLSQEVLRREAQVRQYIEEYSELFDVDPNLVRALITQESRFQGKAKSPTNAYGFGQFTTIGAKQVQNIADMNTFAADLKNFTKEDASDPDRGIKAICATLWWLFYVKYKNVADKKTQVEAVLTFYNAGGRPAALVVKRGGHANALSEIKALPANQRSQAVVYAPEVFEWFLAWHEHFNNKEQHSTEPEISSEKHEDGNPFLDFESDQPVGKHAALVEALMLLGVLDEDVAVSKQTLLNLTEIRIVLNGKY